MSQRNAAARSAYNKRYHQEHKEELLPKIRLRVARWQKDNKERRNKQQRDRCAAGLSRNAEYNRRSRERLKREAINAMGGCCPCCSESEIEFLTVDHIHGGGRAERRGGVAAGGGGMWRLLRNLGYPVSVYRLMCWNCNWSAHLGDGICVHSRKPRTTQVDGEGFFPPLQRRQG